MRYEVTLRDQRGGKTSVFVEADSGDDAVAKAFKPFHICVGVHPAPHEELVEAIVQTPEIPSTPLSDAARKPRAKKVAN